MKHWNKSGWQAFGLLVASLLFFSMTTSGQTATPPSPKTLEQLRIERLTGEGYALLSRGEVARATAVFQQALDSQKQSQDDDPLLHWILTGLAVSYGQAGNYAERLRIDQRLIEVSDRMFGMDSKEVAKALLGMAFTLYDTKEYDKAIVALARARAIRERIFGSESPEVQQVLRCILNNLSTFALSLRQKGNHTESLRRHREAVEMSEHSFGKDSKEAAEALLGMALTLSATKAYDKAVVALDRARAIRERIFGSESPEVQHILRLMVGNLSLLASSLAQAGNRSESLRRHREAVEVAEQAFGKHSIEVARALPGLAGESIFTKEYGEAADLLERSLGIRESVIGVESIEVEGTLHLLAVVEGLRGREMKRVALFDRCLRILQKEHPNDLLRIVELKNQIAAALVSAGLAERAAAICQENLKAVEGKHGSMHPELAKTLKILADAQNGLGVSNRRTQLGVTGAG